MITEDFVSVEIQELLNKKGFDFLSDSIQAIGMYDIKYNDGGTAELEKCCTYQMAMKWLREVHHMIIMLQPLSFNIIKDYLCENWTYSLWADDNLEIGEPYDNQTSYPSYEEACEAAIKYCLENLI
jgi:hypothetical protein